MEKQERAFKELKERFTRELVLAAPDLDKKLRIEVNTSDFATREILLIKCEDRL